MGGIGSGRKRLRPTTEEALALDVRVLARGGTLAPGFPVLAWTKGPRTWQVGARAGDDALVLEYGAGEGGGRRAVREPVPILRTPCRLGGTRPWFACPGCGRRVALLYGHRGAFRCRVPPPAGMRWNTYAARTAEIDRPDRAALAGRGREADARAGRLARLSARDEAGDRRPGQR